MTANYDGNRQLLPFQGRGMGCAPEWLIRALRDA